MISPQNQETVKSKYPSPITLRLSHEEIERLDQMIGQKTRSAYICECVFGEAVSKRRRNDKRAKRDDIAISHILAMLGQSRAGSNLNQLAKAVNNGHLEITPEVVEMIQETYAFYLAIRGLLIEALGKQDISSDLSNRYQQDDPNNQRQEKSQK